MIPTAITFSLIPPTGMIFPVNETSPVIATSCISGLLIASETRALTIVHPALGPSFGVAPYKVEIFNNFKKFILA